MMRTFAWILAGVVAVMASACGPQSRCLEAALSHQSAADIKQACPPT